MVVRLRTKIQSRIEHRTRAECASLWGTCSNSRRSSFAVFRLSFEAEGGKRSSNSPCVSSWPPTPRRDANPRSLRPIEASGSSCRRSGQAGKRPWSSFSPTRSSAGIARDFGCTGDLFRDVVLGDLPFLRRCRPSFVDLQMRTVGAPERFGLNLKNLGSRSASPPSLDISRSEILTTISANDGRRFFTITSMGSPQWTFLWSRPFGSDCCTPGL